MKMENLDTSLYNTFLKPIVEKLWIHSIDSPVMNQPEIDVYGNYTLYSVPTINVHINGKNFLKKSAKEKFVEAVDVVKKNISSFDPENFYDRIISYLSQFHSYYERLVESGNYDELKSKLQEKPKKLTIEYTKFEASIVNSVLLNSEKYEKSFANLSRQSDHIRDDTWIELKLKEVPSEKDVFKVTLSRLIEYINQCIDAINELVDLCIMYKSNLKLLYLSLDNVSGHHEILDLLGENKIIESINLLFKKYGYRNTELLVLKSDYLHYEESRRLGVITYDQSVITKNKIINRISLFVSHNSKNSTVH
ncbi:hypothetical protein CEQ90_19575 [Lewinellaceae bacterium SD302]|nr:hypothetical protein CEQ90_19575 [Lewinellaceae bacterium SD302]